MGKGWQVDTALLCCWGSSKFQIVTPAHTQLIKVWRVSLYCAIAGSSSCCPTMDRSIYGFPFFLGRLIMFWILFHLDFLVSSALWWVFRELLFSSFFTFLIITMEPTSNFCNFPHPHRKWESFLPFLMTENRLGADK